jgi:ribosomal subunit interface protein
MRVQTVARHCEVPEADLARADERFQRLVRFDPSLASAEVVFIEEKHRKRVEGILSVHGEEPAVARAEEASFRAAVDTVADRLEKILRRRRSHARNHKAPRAADMAPPPPPPPDEFVFEE